MKSAIVATMVGLGIAFTAPIAFAASVFNTNADNLNPGLLSDTLGAWYFNWTAGSDTLHHVPASPPSRSNSDYTTTKGGALVYSGPVRNDAANTVVDIGLLTVTGFSTFDENSLFAPNTEQIIRQDYWGSNSARDHNGIGVMTEGTSDEEQVNLGEKEYLRLSFEQSISLLGFDFASGEHHACGSGTKCGSFELFAYDAGSNSATSLKTGSLDNDGEDYAFFAVDLLVRISLSEQRIRATMSMVSLVGISAVLPAMWHPSPSPRL